MKFFKYHALGNDYVVLREADGLDSLTKEQIVRICHRNLGVGSDGILLQLPETESGAFPVRIFNPDGSEAEKSGNGLRIFARCLWDQALVHGDPFTVVTKGGDVECLVKNGGLEVTVEMGQVSFMSKDIPMSGPAREAVNETIMTEGVELTISAANIGNPHCVSVQENVSKEAVVRFGPHLEHHEAFPNRTNVQFMEVIDRENIRIEIWERGAGYTLASGTSASAAAAVAKRLGLCDTDVRVHMPGGSLTVRIDEEYRVLMSGEVTRVAQGEYFEEMFHWRS